MTVQTRAKTTSRTANGTDRATLFPALRTAHVPERSLADAWKNWARPALRFVPADELVAFLVWVAPTESWNPARRFCRHTRAWEFFKAKLAEFRARETPRRTADLYAPPREPEPLGTLLARYTEANR